MTTPQLSKLPQQLNLEFDRMIIARFREWEKIQKKIVAFQNHLHFTLHCKHHSIFPPSLTLKCSIKGKSAKDILIRAQKSLTNERITWIYKQLNFYKNVRADINKFLFSQLPEDYYVAVKEWMADAYHTHFNNIRSRQRAKFDKLQQKHNQHPKKSDTIVPVTDEDKDNLKTIWVINISKRNLSEEETSLLQKGLNFALSPKSIPINEYIIGIENACKIVGHDTRQAETLRSDCVKIIKNANPLKPNISKGEGKALQELAI